MKTHWTLYGGCILLTALLAITCGGQSNEDSVGKQVAKSIMGAESPQTPQTIVDVGAKAIIDSYATLTVTGIQRHWYEGGEPPAYTGASRCPEPVAAGKERIRLGMTFTNDTGYVIDLSLADIGFDSQDVLLDAATVCAYMGDDAHLDLSQQIAPGQSTSGYMAYDVPTDLLDLTLMYTPDYQDEGWAGQRVGVHLW
jgi:hypothetical protein